MGIIEKPIVKVLMLKGEKGEQGDVNLSQLNNEKNARISADNNLQSQIDGLANGTPLVASSTSGMTDTSKVYVNTTDGNWYYYNGSSWVIGGTYQATGIGENSVSIGNITNLQRKDLYEEITQNDVAFVHTTISQGHEALDDKAITSPFIYMVKGSVITFNNNVNSRITRYNDNKEYVSNTGSYSAISSYTILEDGYYRISLNTTDDTGLELVDALTLVEFTGYREKNKNYNDTLIYQKGSLDEYGNIVQTDNSLISEMIDLGKGSIVKLFDEYTKFIVCIDKYDMEGSYIDSIQWNTNTFISDQDYKLRVRVAFFNRRNIRDDEINIIKKAVFIDKTAPEYIVNNIEVGRIYEFSAHRGSYNIGIPECTIPAYKHAKEQNFDFIEADVRMTSDHIPVICHDNTINRTARNSDGTTIAEDIYVSNSTYDELSQYDYGIYCGNQYAGTELLTFDELLKFAKYNNIKVLIDCGPSSSNNEIDIIFEIVRKYGMQYQTRFYVPNANAVRYLLLKNNKIDVSCGAWTPTVEMVQEVESVIADFPNAKISYDCYVGNMTNEVYNEIKSHDIVLSCYCANSNQIIQAVNYGATRLTINNYLPYELLRRTYDNQ